MFQLLPTVNPALLRAGRDPQPRSSSPRSTTSSASTSRCSVQFWDYMKDIFLHFNFGYSYYSNESVRSLIANRLPATISLAVGAAVLWLVVGVGVGIISALRRHSFLDRAAMGTALVLVSAPDFWLGLLALFLFANDIGKFKIFPGAGSYVGADHRPVEMVHLADPAVVRARGRQRGDLRAAAARQPDRDDGRGLHPHGARQGPARAAGRRATACARRSTRS